MLKILKENKNKLAKDYGVLKIGIFGSFVRDEENEFSDVDIIIELKKEYKNIHNFFNLKRFLEKKLEIKVDLGMENAIKPYFKEKIFREIIYA